MKNCYNYYKGYKKILEIKIKGIIIIVIATNDNNLKETKSFCSASKLVCPVQLVNFNDVPFAYFSTTIIITIIIILLLLLFYKTFINLLH
jgi:hypothetical protein